MFYSIVDKNSQIGIGQYSSEDIAIRAGINTLRLLGAVKITLNFEETGVTLSIFDPKPLELMVYSSVSALRKIGTGLPLGNHKFVFAGRPSSTGWYRSIQIDEIDHAALRASGFVSYKEGIYSAVLIDSAGKPLVAYRLPALEKAKQLSAKSIGRSSMDLGVIARDLAGPGALPEAVPDNAVAVFVLRSDGLGAKTIYKRYVTSAEGFLQLRASANTGTAWDDRSNELVAYRAGKLFPGSDPTIVEDSSGPKKRGPKPKAKVSAALGPQNEDGPAIGGLVTGKGGARVPHGTKPLSDSERRQLELKYIEECGGTI